MQLVNSIHFLCAPVPKERSGWFDRRETWLTGLIPVDPNRALFLSGNWAISRQTATALIGGIVFLHHHKDEPARFGGRVLDYKSVVDPFVGHQRRIEFLLQRRYIDVRTKWPAGYNSYDWRSSVMKCIDNLEDIAAKAKKNGVKTINPCSRDDFMDLQRKGLTSYWPQRIDRHFNSSGEDFISSHFDQATGSVQ